MSAILAGRSCRNVLTVGELAARFEASRWSWVMSVCSGARPTCSSPAVALVRLAIAEIAVPIGCRSAASPDTSSCSEVTRLASALPREVIVCSTELRLPMTWSMTWSLVASAFVSEPTVATSAVTFGTLALKHLDDVAGQLVDVARRQRLEQRLESVEQHGEVERGRGARQRDGPARRERGRAGPVPWPSST